MKVLLIHPRNWGQFEYLAAFLARNPVIQVVFLTHNAELNRIPGVKVRLYQEAEMSREGLETFEKFPHLGEAQAVYQALKIMRDHESYYPDVIYGRSGWGGVLFLKDLFPKAKLIGYFEWFFDASVYDALGWRNHMDFNDYRSILRLQNMETLKQLDACDVRHVPTHWQKSVFPAQYRDTMTVIHEGIDTRFYAPISSREAELAKWNLGLSEKDEIVTYASRGFEPMRCFPVFMDAIRLLLKRRPRCHVILAGREKPAYGPKPNRNQSWKQLEEEKGGFDASRVHFFDWLPRERFLSLLRISDVHVYLTIPYVLSWSMLQAMSTGCCLVASASPPVEEVIEDGINGLLTDYQSPEKIADRIEEALSDSSLRERLRLAARDVILDRYPLEKCLQEQSYMLLGHRFSN
ncbi:MAG: glycosyltransferase [Acetatifactor sp.]|nr:glycosyltransferase [Acetatifactor sp.]